ncbi:ribonuclease D [Psychromonas sp. Urea-02u-13]|uniref:ribonuclease D n=1 Tax=Psychromonas sp. Urea-02u-13 TaxID=2058326 RepID=UPI000C32B3C4|nr:ribonuclease D [Psychromonas sp. Urea-02u-13]PKG38347.1 ribonuclease D [Psychromonas sp. Urea-02u-13]
MQFEMITTQVQLNDFLASLDNTPICLDTEFVRTRTFVAKLGLLQLSQNGKITLIDPISVPDLSDFWRALDNKDLILHASSEDLEIIRQHKRDLNFTLFDTQIACAFLNLGASLGYAKMVETLEGVVVDKGESRTDWCKRPLSEKQVNYAAADVLHLTPCLEKLTEQLVEKKMFDFFQVECQTTLDLKMKKQDPNNAYKSLNNLFKLDRQGVAVIQKLAKWRLHTAKTRDLALNFVVHADNIWLLAHYRPSTKEDLRRLNLPANEIRIHGPAILAIIEAVEKQDPETYPALISRLVDFPAYKKTLKSMREVIQACADKYELPIELIASKRVINEYLSWLWKLNDEQRETADKPKLLTGWRFELVGHQFKH